MEIKTTMYPAAMIATYSNGNYPETPQIAGLREFSMVTNGNYHIPMVLYSHLEDSVHTEFRTLAANGANLVYNSGYSGTQPLPGLAQGATFDPFIDNNVLSVDPNISGEFSVGILAETYVGGQLISKSEIDLLAKIQNPSSPFNGAPEILVTSSSHPYSVITPNPITADSSGINVTASANDTITFGVSVIDTAGSARNLYVAANSQANGLYQIDSIAPGVYVVSIFPNAEPIIASGLGGNLRLQLVSIDDDCPFAGVSKYDIFLHIPSSAPANTQVGICMVAADTSVLEHNVYIDAPENNNGSSMTLITYEYNSITGNWVTDTNQLPDSDTIFSHSINSSLPTVAYFLEYHDSFSGNITSTDDVQVGNLPISVTSAGTINQISLPYASS
jgi:hypothetical protein